MEVKDKEYYKHIVCVTNHPLPNANPKDVTPETFKREKGDDKLPALGWYFYDESYSEHGPFTTLEECVSKFKLYVTTM